MRAEPMTMRRVIGSGALGLPLAFVALPVYVHLPRYYAEVAGLSLAWLGGVLLAARLVDAFIDPLLGWLADRVARPRLLAWSLLPLALGFAALLNPPRAHAELWLLASLILTYTAFSAASVAYQAWGADAGADSAQRARLVAAREGFGLLGVLLAAALPGVLAGETSQLNDGVARLSWLLPPLLLCAALISFRALGSVENRRTATPRARRPLLPSLRRVLGDAAVRRLLAVFVANGIAAGLPATLFVFFVADVLRGEAAVGVLLALYFAAAAASLPVWLKLAERCGRTRAWQLSMWLAIVAFAGASRLGEGDLLPFAAICVASGVALGADLALPTAMVADAGERLGQAGACFGLWNLVAKLNLALAAGLALPLVGALGYVPGSGGDRGLSALAFAYALLPLAFKALAAFLLGRWRPVLESLR